MTTLPTDLPALDVTPGPSVANPLPADRPVRWGILATGRIAGAFVTDLALLDECEVAAVGSRRQESADAFAAEHGIPAAYGDYAALVEDPDVDVVYVATPHSMHREHVELAFEAGKAVLCEKPVTLGAADAEHLAALSRDEGAVPHGGDVDAVQPAHPQAPAAARVRRPGRGPPGACRPRLRGRQATHRPDVRPGPGSGGAARHGDLPADVRPAVPRGAERRRGGRGPLAGGRRPRRRDQPRLPGRCDRVGDLDHDGVVAALTASIATSRGRLDLAAPLPPAPTTATWTSYDNGPHSGRPAEAEEISE